MPDLFEFPTEFVALHVRTTGAHLADGHRMKSVALVRIIDGKPVADAFIAAERSSVKTGKNPPLSAAVCRRITDFVGADTIVCFDAESEISFLNLELIDARFPVLSGKIVSLIDHARTLGLPAPKTSAEMARRLGIYIPLGDPLDNARLAAFIALKLAGRDLPQFPSTSAPAAVPEMNAESQTSSAAEPVSDREITSQLPVEVPAAEQKKTHPFLSLFLLGSLGIALWAFLFFPDTETEKNAPASAVTATDDSHAPSPAASSSAGERSSRSGNGTATAVRKEFWKAENKPADLTTVSQPTLEAALWCQSQTRVFDHARAYLNTTGLPAFKMLNGPEAAYKAICSNKAFPPEINAEAERLIAEHSSQISSWGEEYGKALQTEYERREISSKSRTEPFLAQSPAPEKKTAEPGCGPDSELVNGECIRKKFWASMPDAIREPGILSADSYLWCVSQHLLITNVQKLMYADEPLAVRSVNKLIREWDEVCGNRSYPLSFEKTALELVDKHRRDIAFEASAVQDRLLKEWKNEHPESGEQSRRRSLYGETPERRLIEGLLK